MTRTQLIRPLVAAPSLGTLSLAQATTSAYWAFEDQAPGVLATTLVSEVNGDVLVGKGKTNGTDAHLPAHDADVPGTNICNGLYGTLPNVN